MTNAPHAPDLALPRPAAEPGNTDLPFDVVHRLSAAQLQELHALYQNEWWSKGRTLEETRKCVDGSQI
jgi:hypothetical protein